MPGVVEAPRHQARTTSASISQELTWRRQGKFFNSSIRKVVDPFESAGPSRTRPRTGAWARRGLATIPRPRRSMNPAMRGCGRAIRPRALGVRRMRSSPISATGRPDRDAAISATASRLLPDPDGPRIRSASPAIATAVAWMASPIGLPDRTLDFPARGRFGQGPRLSPFSPGHSHMAKGVARHARMSPTSKSPSQKGAVGAFTRHGRPPAARR